MTSLITIKTYHSFIHPTWNLSPISWHALVWIIIRHLRPFLILICRILGHKMARIIPKATIVKIISIKIGLQILRESKTIKIIISILWATIPIVTLIIILIITSILIIIVIIIPI